MQKKKKRRRYKINWNVLIPDWIAHPKKRRRRIRKSVLIGGLALLIVIISIFTIPGHLTDSKLKNLGYNKSEIKEIRELKLTDTILKKKYYSKVLATALLDKNVNTDYLPLYVAVPEGTQLTDLDFLLYARLEDKGYEEDQIQNLFANLEEWEITPLLLFDYQYNENAYIDDCKANRDHNSRESFSLTTTYTSYYDKAKEVTDPDSITVLVTKNRLLSSTYVPGDMTSIDSNFAVDGVQLRQEAVTNFTSFATDASNNGARIYAVLGYRSYEDQDSAYSNLSFYNGEEYALSHAAKAGASEHQTGLAVNISVVGEESADFLSTTAGQWAYEHCYDYGFIPRYPEGKEYLTGFEAETDHFRYIGKENAEALKASGLTYDEFYALYLDGWNDETYTPSDTILHNAFPTASSD